MSIGPANIIGISALSDFGEIALTISDWFGKVRAAICSSCKKINIYLPFIAHCKSSSEIYRLKCSLRSVITLKIKTLL